MKKESQNKKAFAEVRRRLFLCGAGARGHALEYGDKERQNGRVERGKEKDEFGGGKAKEQRSEHRGRAADGRLPLAFQDGKDALKERCDAVGPFACRDRRDEKGGEELLLCKGAGEGLAR